MILGKHSIAGIYPRHNILQEAMESMVAYSIMESLSKAGEKEESIVSETSWDKWKRGGIVGAASVTGGTIMAITGGIYLHI